MNPTLTPQVRLRSVVVAVAAVAILLAFSTERIAIGLVSLLALAITGAALFLAMNLVITLCVSSFLTAKSQLIRTPSRSRAATADRTECQANRDDKPNEARLITPSTSTRAQASRPRLARIAGIFPCIGSWHASFRIVLAWGFWTAANAVAFLGLPYENMYPLRALEYGGTYGAAWIVFPFVLVLLGHATYDLARERLSRIPALLWSILSLAPGALLLIAATWLAVVVLTAIELFTPDPAPTRDRFRVWFCVLFGITGVAIWAHHALTAAARGD